MALPERASSRRHHVRDLRPGGSSCAPSLNVGRIRHRYNARGVLEGQAVRALFPATFDPVTNGHMDILSRTAGVFDTVVAGVFENERGDTLFTAAERLALLENRRGAPAER